MRVGRAAAVSIVADQARQNDAGLSAAIRLQAQGHDVEDEVNAAEIRAEIDRARAPAAPGGTTGGYPGRAL